jgi:predicted DNA-binding protein YlxM (UPF0122 family)
VSCVIWFSGICFCFDSGLKRILWEQLLQSDLTLSEAADLAGVSAVAIHRQTKRLEKRLMKPAKVE